MFNPGRPTDQMASRLNMENKPNRTTVTHSKPEVIHGHFEN